LFRYRVTIECKTGCRYCINADYCLVCEEVNTYGKYCEAHKSECKNTEFFDVSQCNVCNKTYNNCYSCNNTNCIVQDYIGVMNWPFAPVKVPFYASQYIGEDGNINSDPNCQKLEYNGCIFCFQGYAIIHHKCIYKPGLVFSSLNLGISLCKMGYYKINLTDCGQCSPGCLKCTSSSGCELCEYGYELTLSFDCTMKRNDWFYYFHQNYHSSGDVCQINNQQSHSCNAGGQNFYYNGQCVGIHLYSMLILSSSLHQLIICL
jgi:hypothetical protein